MRNSLRIELRLIRREIAKNNHELEMVRKETCRLADNRLDALVEKMQSSARDMALMSNVL